MQKFQLFLVPTGKKINSRESKKRPDNSGLFFLTSCEMEFQLDQDSNLFFYSVHQNSILFRDDLD
jgi:hypothetical protein